MRNELESDWLLPFTVAGIPAGDLGPSGPYDSEVGGVVTLDQYLSNHVCTDQDGVILQLDETSVDSNFVLHTGGKHFVLVTGQTQGAGGTTDWTVFDPGWSSAQPAAGLSTLSGHLDPKQAHCRTGNNVVVVSKKRNAHIVSSHAASR